MKTPAILQAFENDILPADAQLLQADDPVEIGGHRLTGRLRSSGTGDVYLARGRGAGLVTIKTTHAGTAEPGPERARLRAEAACSRRLPSSCTTRLLRDGTDETPPFLISEHVEGLSLERIVDVKGPLPAPMVTALATDLARTLAEIHDEQVVHGNLTPANVVLTSDGLRVIDFGVAQEISTSGEPAEIGAVADNPGWLAPELLTGGPPGAACDIFGWGCLVTYAATGHSPFGETGSVLDTCALAGSIRDLVDVSVSEDPAARPSAVELTTRLAEPAESTDPPPALDAAAPAVRPRRRIRARAVVPVLVAMVAAALIAVPTATEHSPRPRPPRAVAPSSPPKKPSPRPQSNTGALSAYDAPPAPSPTKIPAKQPRQRRGGLIWMSCGWCSPTPKPTTKYPHPPGWGITWTPGG